ncbi:MAG TPA: rRNA maturation RNase YbeY [Terracidiphilus sp.]|jgi:probable rRNA maturation factor
MILLDPELGPEVDAYPALHAAEGKSRALRLPSNRVLARFLAEAKAAVRLKGQATVLLTSDPAIRRLNRQFRGKNQVTDVLSFPAEELIRSRENIAGDLAISVETARRQAAEQDHTLAMEIKILILHGLLHLAGYDHDTDEGQMGRRERLLRTRFGLPQGLIERAGAGTAGSEKRRRSVMKPSSARNKKP